MATSSTLNSSFKKSMWPRPEMPSSTRDFLQIGAVTSTSMSPALMSSNARFNAEMAPLAASGVHLPGSTNTLSGRQFTMFTFFGLASFASEIT